MEPSGDPCLFCCSAVSEESLHRGNLSAHVDVIFILKHLLEVPSTTLETYLVCCGSPETWISVCTKCKDFVKEAHAIHDTMMKLKKDFKLVQQQLIRVIKNTKDFVVDTQKERMFGRVSIANLSRSFALKNRYDDESPHTFSLENEPIEKEGDLVRSQSVSTWDSEVKVEHCEQPNIEPHNLYSGGFEDNDDAPESPENLSESEDPLFVPEGDNRINVIAGEHDMDWSQEENGDDSEDKQLQETHLSIRAYPLEKQIFCKACGLKYTVQLYDKHENYCHHYDYPKVKEQASKNRKSDVLCVKCPSNFKSKFAFDKHTKLHEASPFHCFMCRRVYSSLRSVRNHLRRDHKHVGRPAVEVAAVCHTEMDSF